MKVGKRLIMLIVLLFCVANTFSTSFAESPDTITLTVWKFTDDPVQKVYLNEWFDEYTKLHPNINFVYEEYPWENYFDKLTISIAGGTGPDIFWISPADFLKYAEIGVLYPFNDLLPQELIDNIYPQSIKAVTVDGNIFALPWEGMDVVTLFYNKNMLAEAGVYPPTTWDELIDASVKLTTKDRHGLYLCPEPGATQNFYWYPFLWQAGGDVVNEDMTESLFDSPATIRALKLWGDLMKLGTVPTTSPPDPLMNRRVAMMVRGPWVLATWQNNDPDFYLNEWDVTALPYPEDGEKITVYGGFNIVVNAMGKAPEEAVNFVTWLYSDAEKGATWLTKLKASISANKKVQESETFRNFWNQWPQYKIVALAETAKAEPAYPPEIFDAVSEAIQAVLFGDMKPEDAAKNAHNKINEYLKTR